MQRRVLELLEDEATLGQAALALAHLRFAAAVARLIRLLGTKHPRGIRLVAALALGAQRDPRATAALLAGASARDVIAEHCLRALGSTADADVLPELMSYLESDDSYLRWAAIQALDELGSSAARQALAAMNRDGAVPAELRHRAGRWLAEMDRR